MRGRVDILRLQKSEKLIQMRHADGEHGLMIRDFATVESRVNSVRDILQHGCGSLFLNEFEFAGIGTRVCSHLLQQGADIVVKHFILNLSKSDVIGGVEEHVSINKTAGIGQLLMQGRIVERDSLAVRGSLRSIRRLLKKTLGEQETNSLFADQPFTDPVDFRLNLNGIDPIKPGLGAAMALTDNVNLLRVITVPMVDNLPILRRKR